MNEIKFKLDREHMIGLKKFHKLKMSKDLIIQPNKDNEIVFSLTDLYYDSKYDNRDFTYFQLIAVFVTHHLRKQIQSFKS